MRQHPHHAHRPRCPRHHMRTRRRHRQRAFVAFRRRDAALWVQVRSWLIQSFRDWRLVDAWLDTPRADLEGDSPRTVFRSGEGEAVWSLLLGVQLGVGG